MQKIYFFEILKGNSTIDQKIFFKIVNRRRANYKALVWLKAIQIRFKCCELRYFKGSLNCVILKLECFALVIYQFCLRTAGWQNTHIHDFVVNITKILLPGIT